MKIDRHHVPWALFVIIATLICGVFFLAEFHPEYLPFPFELPKFLKEAPRERNSYGASPLGLFYGTLALAIFVFASALGIRKKRRTWPIGNVQLWLRAHIWLTIFTIPLVLFHCGGRLGGAHTTTVMVLYAFVMVSGLFGWALQNVLPQMMKERLPREVIYEEIPHVRRRLVESALSLRGDLFAKIVSPKVAPGEGASAIVLAADPSETVLLEFLDEECLPYLLASRGKARSFRVGKKETADDVFRLLRLNVSEEFRTTIDDLQIWCEDRRLMDLQTKLQHWLHGWLLIHVPTSFALLVFTFWHAYVTWTYL